ncbi:Long-chain-acyl-CoA dehydrogenase [Actinobacteria bacterium OK074]|nr:Long-chain-acyl-CoA dehydrogenase [Actinobacteria bacterium OK074]
MREAELEREIFDEHHRVFRESVREFVAREVSPHLAAWETAGSVGREVWRAAGKAGFLAMDQESAYGGGGEGDPRYHVIRDEEMARAGTLAPAFYVHGEVVGHHLGSLGDEEQKRRWLPGFCAGELIGAVAITEPDAGSDVAAIRTTARRDATGNYLISGRKTFVTHGSLAGLIVLAVRDLDAPTRGDRPAATLLVLEPPLAGLTVGRSLPKIGNHAMDTVELALDEVRVPAANVLGRPGMAFLYLMRNLRRERLSIAVTALALAERVYEETLAYCAGRQAFGRPIGRFQHNRFQLVEMATALKVARAFTDRCVLALVKGKLADEEAAMAKWWNTELCKDVTDRCVQLHGGYGYTTEYLAGRAFTMARAQTIFGGTTEIMKEIIGQTLPL